MKKFILVVLAFVSLTGTANAQNSAIEIAQQKTEVEKFRDESIFIKEVHLTEYSDNGLEIYGKIFVDLKNEKKMIGGLHLFTESKMGLAVLKSLSGIPTDDGSAKDLGYIDMDQLDGLIAALNKIIDEAKKKSQYEFSIEYITRGGVGISFTRDGDDEEDNYLRFSKKWFIVNQYGTLGSYTRVTDNIEIDGMTELVTALKDAKTRINECLQDPTLLTKYVDKDEVKKAAKKAAKEAKKEKKESKKK